MVGVDYLEVHRRERVDLLERAIGLLEGDDRIDAAWLHGSMGRGTEDDWSDIDLWIVVADEAWDAVAGERGEFVKRVGELLLVVEAPQNAPQGGAYLLAMYAGVQGPHILDCSWQPRSLARRGADTRVLFDRVVIVEAEGRAELSEEERLEGARHQVGFFWMMVAIVGKYIARREAWEVLGLLRFVWSVVREFEWLVGEREVRPRFRDAPSFAPPVDVDGQLAALRELVGEVEALVGRTPALHDAVTVQAAAQIYTYLDIVKETIRTSA